MTARERGAVRAWGADDRGSPRSGPRDVRTTTMRRLFSVGVQFVIEVDGFTKRYDKLEAVQSLSFRVRPGEILGLVGQNGAGKTTTLRAIAGILDPTRGTLRIGGFDVVRDAVEAKRRLAYVPDTPHPFDLLTVA